MRGAVDLAGAGVAIGLLGSIPVVALAHQPAGRREVFDVPTLAAVSWVLLAAAAAAA